MKLVVSQPMFFPWLGLFEQVGFADIFVHYDDVQFPRGRSFMSRVQILTENGKAWITAPVSRSSSSLINTVRFSEERWKGRHLEMLRRSYSNAPFFEGMFDLALKCYSLETDLIGEFNISAIEEISKQMELKTQFFRSSNTDVTGSGSKRLLQLCQFYGADEYITGHGASRYLDHSLFEKEGIEVKYISYGLTPYDQMGRRFDPYVSILDTIAFNGSAKNLMKSHLLHWRDFVDR